MNKKVWILVSIIVVIIIAAVLFWPKKKKQDLYAQKPSLPNEAENKASDDLIDNPVWPGPKTVITQPPVYNAGTFPLRKGSKGAEVVNLQNAVNTLFLSRKKLPLIKVDGLFGKKTLAALRQHLDPTMENVSDVMYQALMNKVNGVTTVKPKAHTDIKKKVNDWESAGITGLQSLAAIF